MSSAATASGSTSPITQKATPDPQDWLPRFAQLPAPLRLPADVTAPSSSGGSIPPAIQMQIDSSLRAALHTFCARYQTSLDDLLLTAFIAGLHRLTEERDLLLLYAAGGTGPLLPIRVSVDEQTSFQHLLDQVRHWTAATLDDPAGVLRAASELPPVPIAFLGNSAPSAPQNIALAFSDDRDLRLTLSFDSALHQTETANRLLSLLRNLLASAVAGPRQPIDALPLVAPEDPVASIAGPVLDTGTFEPVHATILRNAGLFPGRIAVECSGQSLTYAQLSHRAAAIARHLAAEGIAPGERIALCTARSADMVAALLAILMHGCAYVPLDPLFPVERMQAAIADSQAALLLTDSSCAVPSSARTLLLEAIPASPAAPTAVAASAQGDLAYIIYTSGSTGTPKGVAIGHGALRSLLCAAQHSPGFTSSDVLVAITTITFDISVMDLWLPLFTGARLVVADNDEARNPARLRRLLDRAGATVLEATPGFWLAMIDAGWTTRMPGAARLRVLCGGEPMSRDLADQLLERADDVWNMYGPTECAVWISATRVTPGTSPPSVEAVLPNQQFYVLDSALQPVPPGITGELVLGGTNVGVGYWNRPELSAEKFIPNPFGPGQLYRTGDLAQLRPSGGIRLLGRADFQVKVRGFRIELGEIEHILLRNPAVREAIVVQQTLPGIDGGPDSKALVAFLDLGTTLAPKLESALIQDLLAELRQALPEYMVPAGIVALPHLPRLFNGKVDRKALPLLTERPQPARDTPYLAPRDFLERQLAQIWQNTLGIPRIGVETSYFALGVDSLAALRLIHRVNHTFATELGLSNLLTASTVASLADLIRHKHAPRVDRALVPLRTSGSRPPLFILHGVGGNVLSFFGLAGRLDEDQPVYALQAQALLTGQAALLRLEDMAAFYICEIKTVQPHGPYHLLGYSFGGTLATEMAHQLRAAGDTVAPLLMLDSRTYAYEQAQRRSLAPQAAAGQRLQQFTGNVGTLSRKDRAFYIAGKLKTRAVRYTCFAFHKLGRRRLPGFLKVAWDVNLVAQRVYRPRVNPGRLTLFRARYQDFPNGPQDLGWAGLFPEGIDIHEIDSDHERIFLEPALYELAEALGKALRGQP